MPLMVVHKLVTVKLATVRRSTSVQSGGSASDVQKEVAAAAEDRCACLIVNDKHLKDGTFLGSREA